MGIASSTISVAGTVTSAGKDVNGQGSLAITVDVTAVAGAGTTLVTFDDVTWFTVATIPQFTTAGGAVKKCVLIAQGLSQVCRSSARAFKWRAGVVRDLRVFSVLSVSSVVIGCGPSLRATSQIICPASL